ncbi:MAG: B12-binding domain-containing protein [Candidatus Sumerlaeia bacterium]
MISSEQDIPAFREALLSMNRVEAQNILAKQVKTSSKFEAIERLICPALEDIGQAWQDGRIALSQVYMSGRICERLVDEILPPQSPDRKEQARLGIAVIEDQHLLGKRIVYAGLRASGYEVHDYGGGIGAAELAARAQADKIEILMVSALMMNAALKICDLINELEKAPRKPLVLVGGAPFILDPILWKEVGADAMGYNAADAIRYVQQAGESQQ